ncbi:signal peptidase I [Actinopolymorpha cephalotaxi]|uniref:Signal peptidase I n=1 Tax=Actinopolymorpha cephalotaxi TaxID=504797 RepID=A0ABX2S1U5_9ACTN|nr:signal peptidase I [Actinopolymorpha cephalotaxi]NYH82246.1 signal peptidase I [Actinopolymorpha cephalotaxi]
MDEREIAAGREPATGRASTVGSNDGSDKGEARRNHGKERSFWRELPVLVVLALGLALLIKTFLVQAFYIPSESMENTLVPGDRVLVNKLSYRLGEIQRGDVIVFNGADSWESEVDLAPPSGSVQKLLHRVGELFGFSTVGEKDFIKRVIGLPGDHVVCCDKQNRVTVNGKPITEGGYLHPGDPPSAMAFDIRVPADRLWVMGDHRSASADSRSHLGDPGGGTIPIDHVVGRAFVIVWPLDRVDLLTRPGAYGDAGLASGPRAPAGSLSSPPTSPLTDAVPVLAGAGVVFPLAGLRRGLARRRRRSRADR